MSSQLSERTFLGQDVPKALWRPVLTKARPVRSFDTACTYFHKFRLNFRDAEYNYQDAALASLFVACKVEDTIKKSKEILAAAYNVKNPEKATTPDDKVRIPEWPAVTSR